MDGFLGRDIVFQWGGNSPGDTIAGVREKGIECNGEAIDVTSDENDGWRVVLSEAGQNEVTISLSGVTKDDRLAAAWFSINNRIQPAFLTYPNGRQISGNFYLQSFTDTGPYNDATTFEAELISTGPVTYVAGSN
jgi:predicted secreted protein